MVLIAIGSQMKLASGRVGCTCMYVVYMNRTDLVTLCTYMCLYSAKIIHVDHVHEVTASPQ